MSLRVHNLPVDLEWTVKLALDGRLDSQTSTDFEKTVKKAVSGMDYLILDLAKLTFISSAGIRALMFANKELASRKGSVFVLNPQPQIAKVLEVVKQLPGLHVLGTEEESDQYLTAIQDEVLKKKSGS